MTTIDEPGPVHDRPGFRIDPDAVYRGPEVFPGMFERTSWHSHLNARAAGADVPRALKVNGTLYFRGADLLDWLARQADPLPAADPDA